ncbi:MAG: 50S ribosomal protein L23 [Candidatus Wildermuthbacteria bacterium]|nr:50S ribosomal protein L23 [Candidatus Wildermuthbacteria bacterium]
METAAIQHLIRPHITEKATDLASKNQYVFVVDSSASKREIGRDVANKYGVTVLKTRIVNVHPKKMRLGRTQGMKKGYKKAIVQIKMGEKIEILPT